jgi:oligopeptide transport system ATP-binding protein
MRQRVCIAMALIAGPKLLFADEPTTALDVTVQAQILSVIKDIQKKTGIAVVFITHDFGIVAGLCNRVMVMYAGKIIETASTGKIFNEPKHPYTKALLQSLPALSHNRKKLYAIPGQPPDLAKEIRGCAFAPRCPHCEEQCSAGEIELTEVAHGHYSACIRIQKGELFPENI